MTQAVTIRLAYRDLKLARLVRADDESEDGKVILQNENLRVRKSKRGVQMTLRLEELPGKPTKRRVRVREYDTYLLADWYDSAFLMVNLLEDLKLSPSMRYDDFVAEFDRVLKETRDRLVSRLRTTGQISQYGMRGRMDGDAPELIAKLSDPRLFHGVSHEREISFMEVEPADYKPIRFQGKGFSGICEWGKCKWSLDREPSAAYNEFNDFHQTESPGAARKVFKLLKADPTIVAKLTLEGFNDLLSKMRIAVDYVPSVWR